MANSKQTDGRKAQSDRALGLLIALSVFLALLVFSLPTVIVLFIGMLPSVVAAIIDRSDERHFAYSVAAFNFCGVFPFMLEMWTGEHSISAASNTITDVFTLVVMYGAAAFGWMVYQSVPPVIAQFLATIAQRRVNTLRAQQRKIVDEWGPGVAGEPDTEDDGPAAATVTASDESDGSDGTVPPAPSSEVAAA